MTQTQEFILNWGWAILPGFTIIYLIGCYFAMIRRELKYKQMLRDINIINNTKQQQKYTNSIMGLDNLFDSMPPIQILPEITEWKCRYCASNNFVKEHLGSCRECGAPK